jgi:hypothetical protein
LLARLTAYRDKVASGGGGCYHWMQGALSAANLLDSDMELHAKGAEELSEQVVCDAAAQSLEGWMRIFAIPEDSKSCRRAMKCRRVILSATPTPALKKTYWNIIISTT